MCKNLHIRVSENKPELLICTNVISFSSLVYHTILRRHCMAWCAICAITVILVCTSCTHLEQLRTTRLDATAFTVLSCEFQILYAFAKGNILASTIVSKVEQPMNDATMVIANSHFFLHGKKIKCGCAVGRCRQGCFTLKKLETWAEIIRNSILMAFLVALCGDNG